MFPGKFITLEGPDGAGKSSVIAELTAYLEGQGHQVLTTREPGGVPIAEEIRRVILDVDHTAMDPRTEVLLFAAARRQHLVEVILPALRQGKIVLCDRFVDSSLAYQGMARDIPVDLIWSINQFAVEDQLPALTLLIDVPAEVGLARIHQARGQRQYDRLDQESLDFHNRVRQAFLDLAQASPERIKVIDGQAPLDQVVAACIDVLHQHAL